MLKGYKLTEIINKYFVCAVRARDILYAITDRAIMHFFVQTFCRFFNVIAAINRIKLSSVTTLYTFQLVHIMNNYPIIYTYYFTF